MEIPLVTAQGAYMADLRKYIRFILKDQVRQKIPLLPITQPTIFDPPPLPPILFLMTFFFLLKEHKTANLHQKGCWGDSAGFFQVSLPTLNWRAI